MIETIQLHERVLEKLDMTKEVEDEELIVIIHQILKEAGQDEFIPLSRKSDLGRDLFNAFRKLDILQELLEDDQITEIMINGTEHIFIEKEGSLYPMQKRFADRGKLEDVIQQIVAGANRMVNEASPIVDARLSDGSRVNVVLYPIALNGPIVTIRKFSREAMTMQELIRREAISKEIDEFLEKLVTSKYNIFISGGTGSG